jgi:DNA topoisomerase VI B subunit
MSIKKTTTSEASKPKQRKPQKISTNLKTGDIKEASIAKFMRKRTQLVGFDYGHFKHTQYAVEFIDNALDAIEKFQWDSVTNLENLKNKTASAIAEFEQFDFEAQSLIEKIQNNEPDLVDALKKLYKSVPDIINKIQFVNEQIESLVEYGIGQNEFMENSSLKGSVTSSNFQEKYESFIQEYERLRKKYLAIQEEIDGLDKNPQYTFTLDKEVTLQNLRYTPGEPNESKNINNDPESEQDTPEIEEMEDLEQTINLNSTQQGYALDENLDDDEIKELQKLQKKEKDLEIELHNLVDDLERFMAPVADIVDNEPLVILKLTEDEAPDVYREKGTTSDSFLYTVEVFDNGTGMKPEDLEKFGKYLASSKSQKLRQTRGSQGFGSPSAFSDAQNTTGKPITAISKHSSQLYGVCSEFFTTEKNTKAYVVKPVEVETPFIHGTFVKLHYLNKKYNRGYVDSYIERTSLMNSHISFIFIDPYGEEHFYPRRVPYFPKEPKYALPHPSSVKIGDFQDLLRSSENLAVRSFLSENFVRISGNLAKSIVDTAEFEIECKLKFLNLGIGFLNVISKPSDELKFCREESRIYGRSDKSRMKNVVYLIEGRLKDILWSPLQEFNQLMKTRHTLFRKQKSTEKAISAPEAKKKDIKDLEKILKQTTKELEGIEKNVKKIKLKLSEILKSADLNTEIKQPQNIQMIEEFIGYVLISKTKPANLAQIQIEHLYMAFKDQTYQAPPTDTAIPVGESALETAVIKQYNLTVSNRVDYFGNSEDSITQIGEYERMKSINNNLAKFNVPAFLINDGGDLMLNYNTEINPDNYAEAISELDLVHTIGDDFIAANTRKPTSGKGLAFVVEAVMAYSSNRITPAKKPSQVITRYVNRTPKLRDNTDCALWQGVQGVNWKNYKVTDTFDNGIPKGNYVIYINCSGPYTHLMFKSQSKNALAEDEVLIKEVKYCLEAIGRKLRKYMNKKETREKRSKRSKEIEKNIPRFVESIFNIARTDPKYATLKKSVLEQKINDVLAIESNPNATEQEIRDAKKMVIPSEILSKFTSKESTTETPIQKTENLPEQPKPLPDSRSSAEEKRETKTIPTPPPSPESEKSSSSIKEVTDEGILNALSDKNWHPITDVVKTLGVTTLYDARLIKIKLKALAMKKRILMGIKQGKNVWKLN